MHLLQALKMELQLKETKLHNMEAELEEASQSGGSSEQVNSLRKVKNELQMKVKEQVSPYFFLYFLVSFGFYIWVNVNNYYKSNLSRRKNWMILPDKFNH